MRLTLALIASTALPASAQAGAPLEPLEAAQLQLLAAGVALDEARTTSDVPLDVQAVLLDMIGLAGDVRTHAYYVSEILDLAPEAPRGALDYAIESTQAALDRWAGYESMLEDRRIFLPRDVRERKDALHAEMVTTLEAFRAVRKGMDAS